VTTGGSAAELLARHRAVLPSWLALNYEQPIEIASGKGNRVTDGEGNEYLDFFAGILTNMLGYGVPEVNEALHAQVDTGVLHTSTLYLIRSQVELAERIAALSGIPDAKVFFTSSGTEANEAALLLTTSARRSNQVLALRNSYHGRSYAAMGVTGNRGWSASSLSPVNVSYVMNGYRYRSPFGHLSDADFCRAAADDLRDVILTTTSGDVACMIAEPIQGVGGFATPPDGFFRALKDVLDEFGIPLISDEVQTGWGRTGDTFWGIGAHDVVPDVMTFAKGLGNGLSIGGVVARGDLMDGLTANSISTFGGNPLSTRAALATLDYLERHDLQTNARVVGEGAGAGRRRTGDGGDPQPGTARRQGRAARQRPAYRAAADPHRRRGGRGPGHPARGADGYFRHLGGPGRQRGARPQTLAGPSSFSAGQRRIEPLSSNMCSTMMWWC
jgi:4-aminobutyrate aminotransferase